MKKVGHRIDLYQQYPRDKAPLTLSLPNVAKGKFRPNLQISFSKNFDKQIASCESTGRELSFEWSHHRISSIDSKVRVTLQNSIKHSGSERVNRPQSGAKSNTSVQLLGSWSLMLESLLTRESCFTVEETGQKNRPQRVYSFLLYSQTTFISLQ